MLRTLIHDNVVSVPCFNDGFRKCPPASNNDALCLRATVRPASDYTVRLLVRLAEGGVAVLDVHVGLMIPPRGSGPVGDHLKFLISRRGAQTNVRGR